MSDNRSPDRDTPGLANSSPDHTHARTRIPGQASGLNSAEGLLMTGRHCWSCGTTMKRFGQDYWYWLWGCPGCGIEHQHPKEPEERGDPMPPAIFARQ